MGPIGSRPLASLGSGLLARKGQARPAMRPPTLDPAASLDDLGWNDMGQDATSRPEPAPPPVLVERDALAARIERESAAHAVRGRAAFTLRLDAARHLRLRLASAVAGRSAQALVVDALDRLLDTMPEVEALAARLPANEAIR